MSSSFDELVEDVRTVIRVGRIAIISAIVVTLVFATFSVVLWHRHAVTVEELQDIVAARAKEAQASNVEAVTQCYSTATQAPVLRRVVRAVERSTADPRARADLSEFLLLNELNSPTLRECRDLAEDLNVPIPKGVGG